MKKATIRRLSQTVNDGGLLQISLHLIAEDGSELVFSPAALINNDDTTEKFSAWAERDIRNDNGWQRLSILNQFSSMVNAGLFVPQVLAIAGVKSVDDLPGCQVICARHNGLKPAWVWEITSLDGSQKLAVDTDADKMSDIISTIERQYEARGARRAVRTG